MGLFNKRATTAPSNIAKLGSGRRLRSSRPVDECRTTFEEILVSYRPRKYPLLPRSVDTGHEWLGDGNPPAAVVSGDDSQDDFLAVALWRVPAGSEIGLFPLGSGDDRLTMPITGHWKARDSSLTSIGTIPAGSIGLREPRIATDYVEEVLRSAGRPSTAENLSTLGDMIVQQFLVKAHQFIASNDRRQADQFVASHRDSDDLGRILHDLVAWNPGVAPYIQDLPLRIRALLLDAETLNSTDTFWAQMQC